MVAPEALCDIKAGKAWIRILTADVIVAQNGITAVDTFTRKQQIIPGQDRISGQDMTDRNPVKFEIVFKPQTP